VLHDRVALDATLDRLKSGNRGNFIAGNRIRNSNA
jgi:hypothetical protein